jgi:hypothetical protein
MGKEAAVHVIARDRAQLFHTLSADLAGLVQLRFSEGVPTGERVEATDLLVVDLVDLPDPFVPEGFAPLLERATLWLVTGDAPVHPAWVELASKTGARVVACSAAERAAGFGPVVQALQEELSRQTGRRLARLVLEHEPVFRAVETLVELVCQHPWRVRRPRDLALLTGIRISRLKVTCAALGFHRVEHFIVCVRMVAFEQLLARQRLPLAVARRIVGIGDPTNARRQLKRARTRSGEAFQKLKSLVA